MDKHETERMTPEALKQMKERKIDFSTFKTASNRTVEELTRNYNTLQQFATQLYTELEELKVVVKILEEQK